MDFSVLYWRSILIVAVGSPFTRTLSKTGASGLQCSKFEFPCNNSRVCVKQQQWCDDEPDCPHGDDEAPNCQARSIIWDDFRAELWPCVVELRKAKGLALAPRLEILEPDDYAAGSGEELDQYGDAPCDLKHVPQSCDCGGEQGRRSLICATFGRLPNLQGVRPSPTFVEIVTVDGSLECLGPNRNGTGVYTHMSQLLHLSFAGTGLSCLKANAFKGHNLAILNISDNSLGALPAKAFSGINTCWLDAHNNSIHDWHREAFSPHSAIKWLDLRDNKIMLHEPEMLHNLQGTCDLDLSGNLISHLANHTFKGLTRLCSLQLPRNQIESIEPGAFTDLQTVGTLNLAQNRLRSLPPDLFRPMKNLRQLELAYNTNLTKLPVNIFGELNCTLLDLRGIIIDNIEEAMFASLPETCNVVFEKLYYCFYAHQIRNCTPKADGISSFHDLLVSPTLVVLAWASAGFTIVSNFAVFVARWFLDRTLKRGVHDVVVRDAKVMSLFIKHLSFSDFLTGIYLLSICYHNEIFKGRYHRFALEWIQSDTCKGLGITAMSSAEISMMILTFIAVDRFATISRGMSKPRMSIWIVRLILVTLWTIGIALAIIPAFIWGDRIHNYYGNNGVCLPLYLQEPHLNGWIYSLFVVIGLNGFMILVIVISYAGIFFTVRKWKHDVTVGTEQRELVWRFCILVFLNLCCWVPTFVFKLLALTRYKVPDESYAWIVTFVFPLNSAMNPIVYSLSSSEFRSRVSKLTGCNALYECTIRHLSNITRRLSSWSTVTSETFQSETAAFTEPKKHEISPPFNDGQRYRYHWISSKRPHSVNLPVDYFGKARPFDLEYRVGADQFDLPPEMMFLKYHSRDEGASRYD